MAAGVPVSDKDGRNCNAESTDGDAEAALTWREALHESTRVVLQNLIAICKVSVPTCVLLAVWGYLCIRYSHFLAARAKANLPASLGSTNFKLGYELGDEATADVFIDAVFFSVSRWPIPFFVVSMFVESVEMNSPQMAAIRKKHAKTIVFLIVAYPFVLLALQVLTFTGSSSSLFNSIGSVLFIIYSALGYFWFVRGSGVTGVGHVLLVLTVGVALGFSQFRIVSQVNFETLSSTMKGVIRFSFSATKYVFFTIIMFLAVRVRNPSSLQTQSVHCVESSDRSVVRHEGMHTFPAYTVFFLVVCSRFLLIGTTTVVESIVFEVLGILIELKEVFSFSKQENELELLAKCINRKGSGTHENGSLVVEVGRQDDRVKMKYGKVLYAYAIFDAMIAEGVSAIVATVALLSFDIRLNTSDYDENVRTIIVNGFISFIGESLITDGVVLFFFCRSKSSERKIGGREFLKLLRSRYSSYVPIWMLRCMILSCSAIVVFLDFICPIVSDDRVNFATCTSLEYSNAEMLAGMQ